MRYRLVAVDLDGTTINDNGEVSEPNLEAIRIAAANGTLVVPVTGRTYQELPPSLLEEASVRYVVFSNGAGIMEKQKGVLFQDAIAPATAKAVFELLNTYDTMIEVYTQGRPVTERSKLNPGSYDYYQIAPVYRPVVDATRSGEDDLAALFTPNGQTEMFNVFFRCAKERLACLAKLKLLPDIEVTTSMDNNLEILKRGVHKGTGLLRLCRLLHIEPAEVIALGDSQNDLPLFKAAGLRLAVRNACRELKAIADAVICSNNEHAVAYALAHYRKRGEL